MFGGGKKNNSFPTRRVKYGKEFFITKNKFQ